MDGVVIKNTGSQYLVRCTDGTELYCMAKGNLRLKGIRSTNPVAVGDRVEIVPASQDGQPAYIKRIHPRRNYIIRRASNLSKESHILGANLDAAMLVCTINDPVTTTVFIDRFLATAEAYRVPVILVFNKIDCYTQEDRLQLDRLSAVYTAIGYPCCHVSAITGEGLPDLKSLLDGKLTLLAGHSGVGKSSLINALIPHADLRTGAISQAHHTGMHTTTFSQMIDFPDLSPGSALIDTPGIKGFGTLEMGEYEVSHYFPEIFAASKGCRFGNCTHTHEPGCAVLEALRRGEIAESRYISYLSILEDENAERYRPEY
ncbi:ribosome small subunit-dependent GTPase A [Porphyromonas gingivalis]|uniref:ribosome small subunit-dependent GTPase A n=1 Tax=Porphyromonas gingivalis TaxID=837 RepID=UPI0006BAAE93|nr:ribosome small subunit-dependent GTPase A [Porphyromonas gingivalis]PDP66183.1 ribosome small subunit-dependent GTPase A [Porphyromonas gingivalis]RRG12881.1 ribosome small subunit-dependent GTPase A [Porphyromonas gingivalis]GAP81955.1 ribosome-associated GTPase [Porphyromonas gingivalis]SJL35160.1 GTPase RsgA [Porphyromonas gingivalis]